MIGIYVHIPFCIRKCLYCDFVSFVRTDDVKKAYVDRLIDEIRNAPNEETVDSVFFGGGTPSLLDADLTEQIMSAIKEHFTLTEDFECTIEMNPGTVSKEKLEAYLQMGFNRLSIGLQSCNDDELRILGRVHTYEEFEQAFLLARQSGFHNINIDLMSAIPNQTVASYQTSLHKVMQLRPEHISAYSLIIEEGTPFAEMELQLPDEDEEREMYYETKRILAKAGYERYEISNYALPGYECRHNTRYWTGESYLGFGISAASFYNNKRVTNASSLEEYIASGAGHEEEIMLTKEDKMSEFFILGLRMSEGVTEEKFLHLFGVTAEEVFGEVIEKHLSNGLLIRKKGKLCLTEKGTDVSNYVLCDFVL